jgi:hypothetical protein
MYSKLEVGKYYKIKSYKKSGYNFPEGRYKLKIIKEGFPEKPINNTNELKIAEEQWLEGLEETNQYEIDLKSNWYYFKFPINNEDIDFMWLPESVVIDIF